MSTWEFLGEAIDVVEVAVRLVLMLLVELGLVEAFIVEFRRRWGRRLSRAKGGSRLTTFEGQLDGLMIRRCGRLDLREQCMYLAPYLGLYE